jgi:hypothetical protein
MRFIDSPRGFSGRETTTKAIEVQKIFGVVVSIFFEECL